MNVRDRLAMRPILVNTKQKIAVLASGLTIATTGFVAPVAAAASAADDRPTESGQVQQPTPDR